MEMGASISRSYWTLSLSEREIFAFGTCPAYTHPVVIRPFFREDHRPKTMGEFSCETMPIAKIAVYPKRRFRR